MGVESSLCVSNRSLVRVSEENEVKKWNRSFRLQQLASIHSHSLKATRTLFRVAPKDSQTSASRLQRALDFSPADLISMPPIQYGSSKGKDDKDRQEEDKFCTAIRKLPPVRSLVHDFWRRVQRATTRVALCEASGTTTAVRGRRGAKVVWDGRDAFDEASEPTSKRAFSFFSFLLNFCRLLPFYATPFSPPPLAPH